MRFAALAAACLPLLTAAQPDPADLAARAIGKYMSEPFSSDFWSYSYGPAIMIAAAYEATQVFGQEWTRAADRRLALFASNSSEVAYKILNNIAMPWDSAVGDHIGLYGSAYLAAYDFHQLNKTSNEWTIAVRTADQYIIAWPYFTKDGTFSRTSGWAGQPPGNLFLWNDDAFMGNALLARLALHGAPNASAYLAAVGTMAVTYESYVRDSTTGLYFHGANAFNNQTSCCFWGRANGWQMMANIEMLEALAAGGHPAFPAALAVFQRHASAMWGFQSPDGRWHQVINDTSTYLETSVTSMTLFAYCKGVMNGWLDATVYGPSIESAWAALDAQVDADGTVNGICSGTGIMADAAAYNARPTTYLASSPGLGSVFRAAIAYFQYKQKMEQLQQRV